MASVTPVGIAQNLPRREFSTATKRAAWERCGAKCEGLFVVHPHRNLFMHCHAPLDHGNFHYDHIIPDWFSKEDELENCQVLCRACHKAKTANDRKKIAKSKRIIDKRAKVRKPKGRPMPGTVASGIRKRMDGRVEKRFIKAQKEFQEAEKILENWLEDNERKHLPLTKRRRI